MSKNLFDYHSFAESVVVVDAVLEARADAEPTYVCMFVGYCIVSLGFLRYVLNVCILYLFYTFDC